MIGGTEGVISLVQKQNVFIKHREVVSNRQIARELGIDKNTFNTYVMNTRLKYRNCWKRIQT